MSAAEDDGKVKKLPVPYEVGYGRPPAEHRFRKGISGNPGGRPRGAANKPKINTGLGMRAAEEFLREEAYRTVALREGDKIIELPTIQAVFRAMGVSALKGNRLAQKTLSEMITNMEQRDADSRMELFGKAIEYKQSWEDAIERAVKAGTEPPRPIPHPADIILDPNNGGVRFAGPMTAEQRGRLEEALKRRHEAQEEVTYFAKKYRRARSEEQKARFVEEWHWEQRMFDIINQIVPDRYKAKLENRSYKDGASREGKALQELRDNREIREEFIERE